MIIALKDVAKQFKNLKSWFTEGFPTFVSVF